VPQACFSSEDMHRDSVTSRACSPPPLTFGRRQETIAFPILLIVGAVGLVGGALLFWRQQRVAVCTPGALRTRPVVRNLTLSGLLLGAVLLYLGYTYA
jgi:hypothetical protein